MQQHAQFPCESACMSLMQQHTISGKCSQRAALNMQEGSGVACLVVILEYALATLLTAQSCIRHELCVEMATPAFG